MDPNVLAIANQPMLWFICGILVVLVVIQAAWFVKLCKKEAVAIGYDVKNVNQAVKTGMVTALGPAFAGFIVMVGMMSVVGGPITWQRLSIIGAAQTELTAAQLAAQAMGLELGGPGYDVSALTLGFFVMGLNGCGWLLMTAVATGSMESVRQKMAGGDPKWLTILSSAITCGLFGNLVAQRLLMGKGQMIAAFVGFACQIFLDRVVGPKVPAIKSLALGISLIVAILAAAIFYPLHIK